MRKTLKNMDRHDWIRSARHWGLGALLGLIALLTACSRPSTLEEIHQENVLHVVTLNAPSTYYVGRDGPAGFEYEMAKRFADYLGVELRIQVVDNLADLFSILNQGYTHFAAAGLTLTDERRKLYGTSPSYLEAQPVVIYHRGSERPRSPEDLADRHIRVIANSAHIKRLQTLAQQYPSIRWEARTDIGTIDLLKAVNEGDIDLAIIDSNDLAMNQVFFPKVARGFKLQGKAQYAWLFPTNQDPSLLKEADRFFKQIRNDGTLAQLRERYYGHLDQLNYVGARTFVYHLRNRLPNYKDTFQEAAQKYGLDWRLLAAIGYQESHWRPNAVSPTGVRGLMMLTQATARHIGIENRLDPESSILGGAGYFRQIYDRLPEHITDPDRTWFALASYNVGMGHLEDARILAERDGKDPDKWMHVKEYLPRLAQKKWYVQTEHGYARGHEPVVYVQNIRRYYDVLKWMMSPDEHEAMYANQATKKEESSEPLQSLAELEEDGALDITPPAL
ncbi:membrane-bound lytic murein transglycosylase MltF [Marinobacteraceae bacterium S3BR75-40.1]